MIRFRSIVSLLLVAVWLPAISHCKLEVLPGFSFLVCGDQADDAPHQDNDCDSDGCAQFEDGLYKTEDAQDLASVPVFVPADFLGLALERVSWPSPGLLDFPATGPPELPVTWQFSRRTALPVRAPSLTS